MLEDGRRGTSLISPLADEVCEPFVSAWDNVEVREGNSVEDRVLRPFDVSRAVACAIVSVHHIAQNRWRMTNQFAKLPENFPNDFPQHLPDPPLDTFARRADHILSIRSYPPPYPIPLQAGLRPLLWLFPTKRCSRLRRLW